jgi:hypothetical protein
MWLSEAMLSRGTEVYSTPVSTIQPQSLEDVCLRRLHFRHNFGRNIWQTWLSSANLLTPEQRRVQALKQARQFEVRKLSAQLWKLKEGAVSGGRKKRNLTSAGEEERLRTEIEALKALDLEPVTQMVRSCILLPAEKYCCYHYYYHCYYIL